MVKNEKFMRGAVITGVDFSPDGSGLFFADWTGGWALNEAGRVHRVFDPERTEDPEMLEAKHWLNTDFNSLDANKVLELFESPNMRVRLKAQFKLAELGEVAITPLIQRAMLDDASGAEDEDILIRHTAPKEIG